MLMPLYGLKINKILTPWFPSDVRLWIMAILCVAFAAVAMMHHQAVFNDKTYETKTPLSFDGYSLRVSPSLNG